MKRRFARSLIKASFLYDKNRQRQKQNCRVKILNVNMCLVQYVLREESTVVCDLGGTHFRAKWCSSLPCSVSSYFYGYRMVFASICEHDTLGNYIYPYWDNFFEAKLLCEYLSDSLQIENGKRYFYGKCFYGFRFFCYMYFWRENDVRDLK